MPCPVSNEYEYDASRYYTHIENDLSRPTHILPRLLRNSVLVVYESCNCSFIVAIGYSRSKYDYSDSIRYDTNHTIMFNVRSKLTSSQLSLPHVAKTEN